MLASSEIGPGRLALAVVGVYMLYQMLRKRREETLVKENYIQPQQPAFGIGRGQLSWAGKLVIAATACFGGAIAVAVLGFSELVFKVLLVLAIVLGALAYGLKMSNPSAGDG